MQERFYRMSILDIADPKRRPIAAWSVCRSISLTRQSSSQWRQRLRACVRGNHWATLRLFLLVIQWTVFTYYI